MSHNDLDFAAFNPLTDFLKCLPPYFGKLRAGFAIGGQGKTFSESALTLTYPHCVFLNVAPLRLCVRLSFCFLAVLLGYAVRHQFFVHATAQRRNVRGGDEVYAHRLATNVIAICAV